MAFMRLSALVCILEWYHIEPFWGCLGVRACYKQLLRSSRRNVLPVELIDGPFLMRHEHVAGTLVERREIVQTSPGADGVLHDPPEAFNRVEVVPTMGW